MTPLRIFGVALAGLVVVGIARHQLGKSFSVLPQAKGLVTHIRNPMYVFVDVMILGLIIAFQIYWLFAILVLMAVAHVIQSRREAKVLKRTFGQDYLEYRVKTWF